MEWFIRSFESWTGLGPLSQDDRITVVVFSSLEVLLAVGLAGAVYVLLRNYLRARRLTIVMGSVVRHEQHVTRMTAASGHGSNRVRLLRPVVRFTAPDGRIGEVKHAIASNAPPPVGAEVRVGVDTRRGTAEVYSPLALYLAGTAVAFAMVLFLSILIGVELSVLG